MDSFDHIALIFKKDCVIRLKALENAQMIMEFSDSVATALRLIFIQSEIYADDYEQLKAILPEIERLRNCLDTQEEILDHARRLYILNFNPNGDAFDKEICYSYACKMLSSTGPRIQHFSGKPTSSQIVDAELWLALHSPYIFNPMEEDLFCYETME